LKVGRYLLAFSPERVDRGARIGRRSTPECSAGSPRLPESPLRITGGRSGP
jgi:hypothetical protein